MEYQPAVLQAGRASLEVLPQLGMIATSLRVDNIEFLAMPRRVEQYVDGHCTGMPLLHPWANRLAKCTYPVPATSGHNPAVISFEPDDVHLDRNGLPIHGTMQGRAFDVIAHSDAAITATYEFGTGNEGPKLLKSFPFPHRITIDMELQSVGNEHRCIVTTRIDNNGTAEMPISFGWHPFFVLPSRPRAAWKLRTPACDRHELSALLLPTGTTSQYPELTDVIGDRTYDDHFALGKDRTFVINDDDHSITVQFDAGYPHLQLYLPGAEGLLPGDFVCIEPMTAPSNALVVATAPTIGRGNRYDATFTITIS